MNPASALGSTDIPVIEMTEKQRGLGELSASSAEGRRALPLAGVSIRARVAERVAQVEIEQRFQNPYAEALEATYIFPLAGGAAVSKFELQVGARILRGKVEERGEARRQYQRALDEGKRAALLEQERDDVFTVQVGNLPPGEEVTVRVAYAEKLPFFEDGVTELRLPLVVAPRYIGGQAIDTPEQAGRGVADDTSRVPDASRISPPRLAPGFDPKVALQLSVELLHGKGLADLSCSQHATRTQSGPELATISLAREQEPLDRDFVLRWRLAGEKVSPSLLVHREADGRGFALLSMVPPRREGFAGPPRDVVFVLDRSGSMGGVKMASAARACSQLLGTLGPRDRFAALAFDDVVEWQGGRPAFAAADPAGIARGDKWLRTIDARNGTELDGALQAALTALASRPDAKARAAIVVLLTDGQVGDESSALKLAQQELGGARIFTVGIDTAVNDGFLKRLAALGRGTAAFVEPGAALEEALRAVGREIGAPLIVDLAVEDVDAGLLPNSAAPSQLSDLFEGRAATASFRLAAREGRKQSGGAVRVTGRHADGSKFSQTVPVVDLQMPALGQVWARARVADLEDRYRLEEEGRDAIKAEIISLAIAHTLLTRFTAFVVVDETEVANPQGTRREVTQPVELPAGWSVERELAHLAGGAATAGPAAHSGFAAFAMPSSPAAAPRAYSPRSVGRSPSPPHFDEADDFGALDASAPEEAVAARPSPPKGAAPPVAKKKEAAVDRAAELQALCTRFAELEVLWAQLCAELLQRVPPAAALEALRTELLVLLARCDRTRLIETERLLRATLFVLLEALRAAGADAAPLRQLFLREEKQLQAARKELDAAAGSRRFWESSI